jgi:hypothetical protein
VRAQVTPDASAFVLTCSAEQLLACAARLTTLLRPAPLSASELTAAHVQLREARSGAHADATRSAEAAALRALLGAEANGLFPLGEAEHDVDASAAVVQAFVDAHYGSQRALLLAEGDVDAHALDALGLELREAPAAPRQRESRQLPNGGGVAVEVAHENAASVALRARSLEHARAIVHLLRDPAFLTNTPLPPLDLAAFELRGGALVLLTLPTARLQGRPEDAARELAVLALRASDAADVAALGREPEQRRLGRPRLEWAPRAVRAPCRRWGSAGPPDSRWRPRGDPAVFPSDTLGLGITLDGGRADALDEADPTRARAASPRPHCGRPTRAPLQQARPWHDEAVLEPLFALPDLGHDAAVSPEQLWGPVDATLPNGALLRVALSPTGENGVLVAFDGGPGEDGEPLHGRAALAVTALAQRCVRMLGAMDGVSVATRVAADRVGLWFEDSGAGWARVVDVAARCALEHVPDDADLQDAKRALLTELGADGSEARMRGWVAMALSPSQPGRVAPAGAAERLDAVRVGDVTRALERLRVGARTHLSAFVRASPGASRVAWPHASRPLAWRDLRAGPEPRARQLAARGRVGGWRPRARAPARRVP